MPISVLRPGAKVAADVGAIGGTRHVLVATTLLDEAVWPDARVAELYGHRWTIETCFAHLKTTMRMDVLCW